nr:olfactory receptor 2H1-like [Cavia porcellus]
MKGINCSSPTGFILLGFSHQPQLELVLLLVISIIYIVTPLAPRIHILLPVQPLLPGPCFTISIVPQMLWNLKGPEKAISYPGPKIQLSLLLGLSSTECVLLSVMAYDHFNAICHPLHYVLICPKLLQHLAALPWISGFQESTVQTSLVFHLHSCSHHRVDGFICEEPALIQIAWEDTAFLENEHKVLSVLYVVTLLELIVVSYGCTVRSVLKINLTEDSRRAFGTCTPHGLIRGPDQVVPNVGLLAWGSQRGGHSRKLAKMKAN